MNIIAAILIILIQTTLLQSSHHGHSHDIETPHFKYSREANEEVSFFFFLFLEMKF